MFWKKKKLKNENSQQHVSIGEAEINDGDPQSIIKPAWYSVNIYDGEEKYNSVC